MKKLLAVTLLVLASQGAFAIDVCKVFTKTCTNESDEAVRILSSKQVYMIKGIIELGYDLKTHSKGHEYGDFGNTWIFTKLE